MFGLGFLQEIRWAGNPYTNKKTSFGGETFQPLEPRKSFASWSETVVGKCRAWTDEQRETAGVLCLYVL
jgi:light-regulated signal transduction histidine kinase (bacteriophytochrome)